MYLRHYTMVLGLLTVCVSSANVSTEMPGVTPTSIRIDSIFPFSGPASSLGNTGKGLIA
jgi:branched-chain amino acid transport system substrate-binding protein